MRNESADLLRSSEIIYVERENEVTIGCFSSLIVLHSHINCAGILKSVYNLSLLEHNRMFHKECTIKVT